MLDLRCLNDGVRLAVFSTRASVRRTSEVGLDLIEDRFVEVSCADIGIKHALVVRELFRAGRVFREARPRRSSKALGNRDRGRRRPRLSAATKGNCGQKKG